MHSKINSQYLDFLRNKYPSIKVTEIFPASVKPEDVSRVIYKNETIEILFKHTGKLHVAILSQDHGQGVIMRLKKAIAQRKEYLDRVEDWECRDVNDFFSMDMQFRLIDSRMNQSEKEFREETLSVIPEFDFNLKTGEIA